MTDLVTILRHELAKDTGDGAPGIDPFGSVCRGTAGGLACCSAGPRVKFSESERWWVRRICDVVKSSSLWRSMIWTASRSPSVGTFGFVRDFGDAERARAVLDELNQELTA